MSFGPQLPPHLQKKPIDSKDEESGDDQIGPCLPPGFTKNQSSSDRQAEDSDEDDSIGPALPPGFKKKPPGPSVGPSIGPSRPSTEDRLGQPADASDDDEDVIGPQLPGSSVVTASQRELESRAHKLRVQAVHDAALKDSEGQKAVKRETWMLELPEEKAKSFGLGPRTFAKASTQKAKRDSSWADTPEDRARKAAMANEEYGQTPDQDQSTDPEVLEYLAGLKRDQAMDATAKVLKAKRGESLYESHEKKKAKKDKAKAMAEASGARRPFDREQDLQVNRFDEAAKAAMLKKARKMDERFVSGQNKYI